MRILCITPIKHLSGLFEYIKTFGDVDYFPDLLSDDFSSLDISSYDVIFCNPNKQNYVLNSEILHGFGGKIVTASTGLNHIDLNYCNEAGIQVVSHTKDYALINQLPSTAELAFGLMLSLMRNIPKSVLSVSSGEWNYEKCIGNQLFGKTIGIVGRGRLGTMMHNYCSAFGMNVEVYDPPKGYDNFDISSCDVITLHVHSKSDTIKMINEDFIKKMKNDSYIINTSRGEIVDEYIIVESIKNGKLSGYAADVISDEYGNREKSIIVEAMKNGLNIILTPHIGGMTWEGQHKAYKAAIDNLRYIEYRKAK